MPRILICTVDAWNSTIGASTSNTFSALFSGYPSEDIANLYIREEYPDSHVCGRYFQISEQKVIKSLLKRKTKTGKLLTANELMSEEELESLEYSKKLYQKNRAKRSYLKLIIRELIWFLGRWKTPELNNFIENFAPDVIIFGMEGYIHFNRICRYAVKQTGAKAIGYFWDDNFTYKQMGNNIGYYFFRFFQRRSLKKLSSECSAFWAISQKTKEEADDYFGIDSHILTKPIRFAENEKWMPYSVKNPIRMLYTGNLMIGRLDTVITIAKALDYVNSQKIKIELEVYTPTVLTEREKEELGKFVHIYPPVGQEKIADLQRNADILLFVEDIDGENSRKARLSFSTKITDYLHSGKCIVAIGNEDTAPMQYFKDNNAAVCITDKKLIEKELSLLINDPTKISDYGKYAFMCGMKNHSQTVIDECVRNTIAQVMAE